MRDHTISVEYCPKCNWLLRAAYFAQEFLTSFDEELKSVTLIPSQINGSFIIRVNQITIFDRKEFGGFPEVKVLKQKIRDVVAPHKSLGHSGTPSHNK